MVWIDVMDITKWSISGSEKSVPAKDHQSKRLRCAAIVPSYGHYVAYAYPPGGAGSVTAANTIGMVRVTCCNAATLGLVEASRTSGASATNSAADLRRSTSSAAQR